MQIKKIKRIMNHLLCTRRDVLSYFPKQRLDQIEYAISESEKIHMAELLCIIESGWDLRSLYQNKTTQKRALEWFGLTRLWDSVLNTGILIYISFADKQIEIIADRGVAKLISNDIWQTICCKITELFKEKLYIEGVDLGLKQINSVLIDNVPRNKIPYYNQYPNQVIVI